MCIQLFQQLLAGQSCLDNSSKFVTCVIFSFFFVKSRMGVVPANEMDLQVMHIPKTIQLKSSGSLSTLQ